MSRTVHHRNMTRMIRCHISVANFMSNQLTLIRLTPDSPMMTSSNGNIFRVTGHLCGNSPFTGEFPAQRPVTRNFDVFCDLCLNKRLSKQWWGWWLRRHRAHYDVIVMRTEGLKIHSISSLSAHNPNPLKNVIGSIIKNNSQIRSQFSSCHGSWAVVAWGQLCPSCVIKI